MAAFFNKKKKSPDLFLIGDKTVRDNRLLGSSKKRWVEDAWTSTRDQSGSEGSDFGFLGLAIAPKRLFALAALIAGLLLILLGRSFYLQIWRGDLYLAKAEANRLRLKAIPAERGLIYDANRRPLVTNLPTFSLELLPGDLPKETEKAEEEIKKIAQITGVAETEIAKTLADFKNLNYRAVTVKDNLDYESAIRLLTQSAELPGISIEKKTRRQYLTAEDFSSLSHLLGYLGKVSRADLNQDYLPTDALGKSGLEKFYEQTLRGLYGKKEIEVDFLGREKRFISQQPPSSGKSLILALDLDLQKKIEEVLRSQLRALNKKRGSVIALNPQNGEILSLVSLPAYDNNLFNGNVSQEEYNKLVTDEDRPLFSRAWSGEYPSGSVIKPLLAAAALEEKLITDQTTFLSNGGLEVGQWFFPDWKAGGHGLTNVVKALAESVNTFFYIIGGGYKNFFGLGVEKITSYYKKFGLTGRLNLDLPGEATGFLPSPEWKQTAKNERWYIGDTYNISIGQGDVLVTPLQVASYTAIFGNGGKLYQPRLVKAILSADGQIKELAPTVLAENLMSPETLKIIRTGLRSAVREGSARSLSDLAVTVAGKTGTAQWSRVKSPHAWFTGFAPYDNPKIVLTILIEEGGEGSAAAVPVAKEVLQWWTNHLTVNK